MVPTAIAEPALPSAAADEVSSSQLTSPELIPASVSMASTSPLSSTSSQDVHGMVNASSAKPSASESVAAPDTSAPPISIAVLGPSPASDTAVPATTSATAPAAMPTGITTPSIAGLMQVGMGLSSNGAAMDDIIAAQVEWYLSRANLPTDNFLKSHMDVDLWVSLELILTFPRMVRLGARDKSRVALLLHARSADIEVDLQTYRIRPAWALRSHLLVRGVPHTATEADLAALLRIPYVAPPAPDTATPTISSPSSDPSSTPTSDPAPPTNSSTNTPPEAPHFRGLMSVMQVSMAGEWVAVFAMRGDAAAALPHVDGQIVCGQPISAEVFIEGLEPHSVPAPSAVYQSVPSYYSHTHPQQAHSQMQPHPGTHQQMPSTMQSSPTADPSLTQGYSQMPYTQSQSLVRSHNAVHVQSYAPYAAGRARAMSENGDGDDMRSHYGHSQGHGQGYWQRMNGQRVNGHRHGGPGSYSSNHGGGYSNSMRGSLNASGLNDRSRSPSALSSLSATNGSTNRRPRRTARRPTRRGSPGDGTLTHPNAQTNGTGYGNSHGHRSHGQNAGSMSLHGASGSHNFTESHKSPATADDRSPGQVPFSETQSLVNGALPMVPSAIYDHYHHPEQSAVTASTAMPIAGADVAAMNFPPLQSSSTAGLRSTNGRIVSRFGIESAKKTGSDGHESNGESKTSNQDACNGRDYSGENVLKEVQHGKANMLKLAVDDELTKNEVLTSGGDWKIDGIDKTSNFRDASSLEEDNDLTRLSISQSKSPIGESNIQRFGGGVAKPEPNCLVREEASTQDPTVESQGTDESDMDKEQELPDTGCAKVNPKVGAIQANVNIPAGGYSSGNAGPGNISTAVSGGIGNARKVSPGAAATGLKSYAAILLSPPRTPTARIDSGKQNSNAKSGSKSTLQAAKGEGKNGGKGNGRVTGSGGKVDGCSQAGGNGINGRIGRFGSGNLFPKGPAIDASPSENGVEKVGPNVNIQPSKSVRRPPRSPSVWAHKPASVVKAGPAISKAPSTGYGGSLARNGRTTSADYVGNGTHHGVRARTGRVSAYPNGRSHTFSNGNVHHPVGAQGAQQLHSKQPASSHVRSQGNVPSQSSAPAQTPAPSHARTVVG